MVCRSCGSEVSPYVTECPYCGTRIRKRAPELERRGDELQARESRRSRRRRAKAERATRRAQRPERAGTGVVERLHGRPLAVISAVALPAMLVLIQRAGSIPVTDLGAIAGPVDGAWWRFFAAPWVYPDVGYLFVAAIGIVIFGLPVERRLGTLPTVILMVAAGTLGMVAANGIESLLSSQGELLLASGGNGVALGLLATWAVLRAAEVRADPDRGDVDVIGAGVAALVLILLPLVEAYANVFAGIGGGAVGAACGFAAAYARRERHPG